MKQLTLDKILERRKHSNILEKDIPSPNLHINKFVEKHFRIVTDSTIE